MHITAMKNSDTKHKKLSRLLYILVAIFTRSSVYFFNMSNSSFFNGDKLTRWAWKEKGMVGFGLFEVYLVFLECFLIFI